MTFQTTSIATLSAIEESCFSGRIPPNLGALGNFSRNKAKDKAIVKALKIIDEKLRDIDAIRLTINDFVYSEKDTVRDSPESILFCAELRIVTISTFNAIVNGRFTVEPKIQPIKTTQLINIENFFRQIELDIEGAFDAKNEMEIPDHYIELGIVHPLLQTVRVKLLSNLGIGLGENLSFSEIGGKILPEENEEN